MPFRPAPVSPSPPRCAPAVRRARTVAAALTAAAALALAACHDGTGYRAEADGRAVPVQALPPAPATGDACTPEMLRFHAGAEPHHPRRMLLAVTNISDHLCTFAAQPYPLLHFGDRRPGPLPPLPYSRPPAPVALPPAGTAYAAVITAAAPGGPGGRSAPHSTAEKMSQFGVALIARTTPAQIGVDGRAPVRVNPETAAVTYWQRSPAAAARW
ncbi:DUF4232 domain-containing protein [Streptomyces sp. NPDC001793]|uniref:DUF4232 domain-containing protein n=1 Tax=Streptomyces sp. NPDC001793 TaxID=3154657 RepID=UPI00332F94D1